MSGSIDAEPVPLHLPAILRNPTNHALRQVEAYNAQRRERALARRDARAPGGTRAEKGRGKRVVRRLDNAQFTSNPHIAAPTKADFTPPVPLHPRTLRPAFPPSTMPRNAPIPPTVPPEKDPFSTSSLSGAFTTSLKGTRAMLRKRGRRAEVLVGIAEREIRGWLSGEYEIIGHANGDPGLNGSSREEQLSEEHWVVMDEQLINVGAGIGASDQSGPSTSPTHRRLPPQHQIRETLPSLPYTSVQGERHLPALLELSRSPAHLSWAVADSFERLVVHLVVRYYELISWSEDQPTTSGDVVRLTHIIRPLLIRPKPLAAVSLLTPETTDLSGQSSDQASDIDARSDGYSDTETETEAGAETDDEVQGYNLVPPERAVSSQHGGIATPSFEDAMAELELGSRLERTDSNTSSMYASSEGGSDGSLGDSMMLPMPVPAVTNGTAPGIGWVAVLPGEEDGSPPIRRAAGEENGITPTRRATRNDPAISPFLSGSPAVRRGWEERPTFFEFLYGE